MKCGCTCTVCICNGRQFIGTIKEEPVYPFGKTLLHAPATEGGKHIVFILEKKENGTPKVTREYMTPEELKKFIEEGGYW